MEVRLVRLKESHLDKVMRWRMLPEVTRYMFTDPVLDRDKQLEWYRRISSDPRVKYWVIRCDDEDIGVFNLNDIDFVNKRCSWGYYIGELDWRGKGIGSILLYNMYEYAFNGLKLNKVWAEALSCNSRVIEIYKKLGCEIEGVFKEHIIKNGEKIDVVRLGLLKSKWEEVRSKFDYPLIFIEE